MIIYLMFLSERTNLVKSNLGGRKVFGEKVEFSQFSCQNKKTLKCLGTQIVCPNVVLNKQCDQMSKLIVKYVAISLI